MTEIVEVMTESGTVVEVITGLVGPVGRSAYGVAQDAGFAGTEAEWLSSLIGPVGRSAYGVAQDAGFVGTEAEWLSSLIGPSGRSAYQVALDTGFAGTEAEWLSSLIGPAGRSAYEIALDAGFPGTEAEWQESLVGPPGRSAYRVALDAGFVGTEAEWLESLNARPAFVDYVGFEAPTADSGTTSLLFDDDGRALVVWRDAAVAADAGVDMYMSRAFWDRAAPEIGAVVDAALSIPLTTVQGAGLRELARDAAGQALLVWRSGATEAESGLDAYMCADFWARGAAVIGVQAQALSTTALHGIGVIGQSLSVGGGFDGEGVARADLLASATPGAALMLAGMMQADGAPVTDVAAPRSAGYDESVAATGLAAAVPSAGNVTAAWPLAEAINRYRAALGLPQVPVVTQCHGQSGVAIENIDDDPGTGTGSLTIWNNVRYWHEQMVAVAAAQGKILYVPYHYWVHGTSAQAYAPGVYLDQLWTYTADYHALLRSLGIAGAGTLLMSQAGGNANTSALATQWHVVDEQLQFCEAGGGVLTTPEYAYQIADNNVHPNAFWTVQFAEVAARAAVETEAGRQWTIRRPKPSVIGNTLVMDYDSLRPGEHLVAHDASRYGGQGIDAFLGYQVEGATITDLAIRGRTVVLTCSAQPTGLRYAMQRQDCTGFAGNKWNAHRGLMRTSDVWDSYLIPGTMLYRWLPSFKMTL